MTALWIVILLVSFFYGAQRVYASFTWLRAGKPGMTLLSLVWGAGGFLVTLVALDALNVYTIF